jgi:hypothetical protein
MLKHSAKHAPYSNRRMVCTQYKQTCFLWTWVWVPR